MFEIFFFFFLFWENMGIDRSLRENGILMWGGCDNIEKAIDKVI